MNANAAQIIKAFSGLVSPMRSLLSEKLWAGIQARGRDKQGQNVLHCDRIVEFPTCRYALVLEKTGLRVRASVVKKMWRTGTAFPPHDRMWPGIRPAMTVVRTDPDAGAQRPRGSLVTITLL